MTNDDLTTALNTAFTAAGITTAPQVAAFINIAALQVKKNTQLFQLQQLGVARDAAIASSQTAMQTQQAAMAATDAAIVSAIAGQ